MIGGVTRHMLPHLYGVPQIGDNNLRVKFLAAQFAILVRQNWPLNGRYFNPCGITKNYLTWYYRLYSFIVIECEIGQISVAFHLEKDACK